MRWALRDAGARPEDVSYINAHGTSTPLGDQREAEAIWAVFGQHTPDIAISATKSMTGHMMGGAGAFEAVATVLSIHEQCVPPTINYRDPDPACDLRIVTEATPLRIRYALSNNIGLGGHNGAVIFKRYEGD
jgi:3-oxoacyl-(acyl-carrier-protein) synthase